LPDSSKKNSKLNPEFRERLLKESKNPLKGLRRILWLLFFGSATLGLFIMGLKEFSGQSVSIVDAGVQLGSVSIFGFLIWFDRDKNKKDEK